ncbi:hypothetical protein [Clostridium brassicae]|uniref:DUF2187 domain-containing protein n=1 Tax=Clostridium brassicae TaxID=2999072 RepID=A0ABT4D6B1_9CLOT|nr:hypothetical protein [Clostridium brassicae]MCY6957840.1 hypothetical protein [Clostridium brassicae]
MIKNGNKVICPYNLLGTVEGFLSKDTVYVNVEITRYKGKKKLTKIQKHIYDIDDLIEC